MNGKTHTYDNGQDSPVSVRVVSCIPLTPQEKKDVEDVIRQKTGNENPAIVYETQKDLLGGIRIEAEGWLIDVSLKKQIQQLVTTLVS